MARRLRIERSEMLGNAAVSGADSEALKRLEPRRRDRLPEMG
jgi:hypothetical protein